MVDIGKKLMDGESYRAGLPKEVYEFARYIAPAAGGDITPEQLVMLLAVAQDDVSTGRYVLGRHKVQPYLQRHRREVLERVETILLLIDAVTDTRFAREVRRDCSMAFGWVSSPLAAPALS